MKKIDSSTNFKDIQKLSFTKVKSLNNFESFRYENQKFDNYIKLSNEKKFFACKHKGFCLNNAVNNGFFRSFAIGYIFKISVSFGRLFFKGKLFDKNLIKSLIFGSDAIKFGQFLGSFSCVYKLLVCLMRFIFRDDKRWFHALAGFIAALSILIDDKSRYNTIALFIFVRAADEIIKILLKNKKLPTIKKASFLFFILCQIPILHCFIFYPNAMDQNYYNWIKKMSGVKYFIVSTDPKKFVDCSLFMHKNPSCFYSNISSIYINFLKSLRVYIPVYVLPVIFFGSSGFFKTPLKTIFETTKSIFWSSSFLTMYIVNVKAAFCFFRNFFQRDHPIVSLFAAFSTGLALCFEYRKRRSELTLYVLLRAIELLPFFFPILTKVTQYKYGAIFLFQISMAVFLSLYGYDDYRLKGVNRMIMNIVFGSRD